MSKRRLPQHQPQADRDDARQGTGSGFEGARSNAARQAELSDRFDPVASMDAARDQALPLVERALFALEIQPADPARTERFLEITARLESDQILADSVQRAVDRWFGGDAPGVRAEVAGGLHAVWHALADGAVDATGLTLPDGRPVGLGESETSGRL